MAGYKWIVGKPDRPMTWADIDLSDLGEITEWGSDTELPQITEEGENPEG